LHATLSHNKEGSNTQVGKLIIYKMEFCGHLMKKRWEISKKISVSRLPTLAQK
jgi:hypothetical protein